MIIILEETFFCLRIAQMEQQDAEAYAHQPQETDEIAEWEDVQDWEDA